MNAREIPLSPFGLLLEVPARTEARALERETLLALLRRHKLVLVRGLQGIGKGELLELASRDPQRTDLVQWSFGPVMEMKVNPATENYLFSREPVPMHWDGAFHETPSVLLFHCVEAPDPRGGGETTFADGEAILAHASPTECAAWKKVDLTYETEKKAHYGGRFTTPMVAIHPGKGTPILRYAEPVNSALNPVSLRLEGWEGNRADFLGRMEELLYADEFLYQHRWETNDLLLADNYSLLHGRRSFTEHSPRHLRRVQIR